MAKIYLGFGEIQIVVEEGINVAQKIRLPNGEIALLVNRNKLSKEFETEVERVGFWDRLVQKSTGKKYRRADAQLYDYVPEDKDLLVESS